MRLAIALVLVALGCATPIYSKPGGHTANEWHREYGQCRAQAAAIAASCWGWRCNAIARDAMQACLEGKGWYREE